ncbi:RagB/SusD family nutrient uptake outer membrane protein [Hymenobacter wooponensis]|uniref:RagB/SusD family nutrient uptake outer membrane protein n=1 Tax=Hymenobacter wooponensis TaxID=1525360 RepID=A0A4Z0MHW2_9BACT|nr:RagB/SusD family nutrient uptake outer membrane protein [Hymenobacter wooponensis]TGD78940.1 RagB/SusD family nutrient uptake outer membrane protein [Hymenobacter wooponensis]
MTHKSNLFWKAALGVALFTTASSCDKVLDQEPPAAFTTTEGYSTPARIASSALGMYNGLQDAEFLGGRALIYADIRADDVDPAAYFGTLANNTQLAGDGTAQLAWQGGYRTIYSVNFFLQQLQANTGIAPANLEAQYIGEGKYIRALTMFYLVNLYAQPYNYTAGATHLGIPIQLVAPDAASAFDPAQNLPRATVAEVYAQIESDLNDAIANLPETYTTAFDKVGRATKDAARALLSRVALYKGDYVRSAKLAGDVITGGRHTLNPSPLTPFRTFTTSESIFSVAMGTSDNPNTNNAIGQHYGPSPARADITITPYVSIPTTQFAADDKRRTLLTTQSTANNRYYTLKYAAISADWVPISRYPEVLLNRAESLVRTTNTVNEEALALLNQVRSRSTAPYVTFASSTELLNAILLERRLELAFEGHRMFDLFRTKQGTTARGSAAAQPYGSPKLIMPIPLREIQQNPNLVQNEGYQ